MQTMTLTYKKIIVVSLVALVFGLLVGLDVVKAGYLETDTSTVTQTYREYNFFAASSSPLTVTATTTSATSTNIDPYFDSSGRYDAGWFDVRGAKNVTLYFSRGDTSGEGNSGSTRFEIEVTPDGTNWYDFNVLNQNLATSSTPTTVGSVTISAATSTVMTSIDTTKFNFYGIRCIVIETTDGEHTCKATASF